METKTFNVAANGNNSSMIRSATIFLQGVIVFIGVVALAIMIRFPMTEGRTANLDLFSIYADPFILYGYAASIPFFIALYQAFRLLGYIGQNKVFSPNAVQALKSIRYCAIALIILIVGAALYIMIFHHKDDDPAGFIAVCIVAIFAAVVVAAAATVCKKVLQDGAAIQSGNE